MKWYTVKFEVNGRIEECDCGADSGAESVDRIRRWRQDIVVTQSLERRFREFSPEFPDGRDISYVDAVEWVAQNAVSHRKHASTVQCLLPGEVIVGKNGLRVFPQHRIVRDADVLVWSRNVDGADPETLLVCYCCSEIFRRSKDLYQHLIKVEGFNDRQATAEVASEQCQRERGMEVVLNDDGTLQCFRLKDAKAGGEK